jgi:hypothetical protein
MSATTRETLVALGHGIVKVMVSLFVGTGVGLVTFGVMTRDRPEIWEMRNPPGEVFLSVGIGLLTAGTVLASEALLALGVPSSEREAKANILAAIDKVAGQLNNTRAVCRKYYVHPEVLAAYGEGVLAEVLGGRGALERRVTRLLKARTR